MKENTGVQDYKQNIYFEPDIKKLITYDININDEEKLTGSQIKQNNENISEQNEISNRNNNHYIKQTIDLYILIKPLRKRRCLRNPLIAGLGCHILFGTELCIITHLQIILSDY